MADPGTERGPYHEYDERRDVVEAVFAQFVEIPPWGLFSRLGRENDIPIRTINSWWVTWQEDHNWRPWETDRDQNHRAFPEEQEKGLVQILDGKFIERGHHCSARAFQALSKQYWVQHRSSSNIREKFAASSNFRARFLHEHNLSLRKATITKPKGDDAEDIARYLVDIERVKNFYGPDRCLNMDETAWWHVQARARTIAPKGAESVSVSVNGNPKAKTSVICTVSMSGDKYPPIYIVKGKIPKMRHSLEPSVPSSRVTLSDSGWMEEGNMLRYLSWLSIAMNESPCALIMDSYSNHVTPIVRDKAVSLEIELVPVPSGRTGEFQPLDRTGFGPLKSMSAKVWDERYAANPDTLWTPAEAASIMEECWPRVTRHTILKGWRFGDEGEEESESEIAEDIESAYICPEYSDEEDPSSGTFAIRREMVESVRRRHTCAKMDEIITVECVFDDLPARDDRLFPVRTHRIQADINQRHRDEENKRKRTAKSFSQRRESSFVFPQTTCRAWNAPESPIDSDGFLFPQPQYRPRDQCFD
jgi:hypothetical protein